MKRGRLAQMKSLNISLRCAVSLLLGVGLSVGARAGDWSLQSTVTGKTDLNDNFRLKPVSSGVVVGSLTDINADLAYSTHNSRFDLIGDLAYQKYLGPADVAAFDHLTPHLTAKYNVRGKTDSLDLAANYSVDDASTVDPLDPLGFIKGINRTVWSGSISYTKKLDARNSVGTSESLQDVIYSDTSTGAKPSLTANMSAFWNYRLTKSTDLRTSVNYQWQNIYSAPFTTNISYGIRSDLTSQITKNLKLKLGGGPRFSNTSSVGFVADAGLDYQYKRGSIGLTLSQSFDPSALGVLQQHTSIGISANNQYNEETTLGLSAQYRFTTGLGAADSNAITINPTLKYQIARNWSMLTGYQWTRSESITGVAFADDIYLSFTRNFVLDK